MADRLRPIARPRARGLRAWWRFVHSAFVGDQAGDEAYVGPVIRALGPRLPDGIGWSGWGRARTFASGAGAIACTSSLTRSLSDSRRRR